MTPVTDRLKNLLSTALALPLLASLHTSCDSKQAAGTRPAPKQEETTPEAATRSKPSDTSHQALSNLQKQVRESKKNPEDHARNVAEVSKRLNSMSPQELEELIRSLPPEWGTDSGSLLFEALYKLARKDASKALELAVTLPRNFRSPFFIELLVDSDPGAVRDWIAANASSKDKPTLEILLQSIHKLVATDPQRGIELLSSGDGSFQKRFGHTIIDGIARTDLARAIQLANGFPEDLRAKTLEYAITSRAIERPSEAFEQLLKLGNPQLSAATLANIFQFWTDKDPKEAGWALTILSGPQVQNIFLVNQDKLSKLLTANPDATLAALQKIVPTESNAAIFTTVMRDLAQADIARASTWLTSYPDSPKKGDLVREFSAVRIGDDPASAISGLLQDYSTYRADVLDGAAATWAKTDSAAAIAFAKTLTGEEQVRFSDIVFGKWCGTDLTLAAAALTSGDLPPAYQTSSAYLEKVTSVGTSYANTDLQKAVAWAGSLPSRDQPAAVSGIAAAWAGKDPTAASEWISTLPAGAVRTAAAKRLIGEIENTDPEMAAKWKASIR